MAKKVTRICQEPGCEKRVRVKSNIKKGEKPFVQYIFARCKEHDLAYRKEQDDDQARSDKLGPQKRASSRK
jgi:hypothetical protein